MSYLLAISRRHGLYFSELYRNDTEAGQKVGQNMPLRGVKRVPLSLRWSHLNTATEKLTSMISTAELAKLTLRILGRGIPTSRCSVKRKWVKTKMGCPKTLMMGRYFSLWELSKLLLTPPYPNKTRQNLCFLYHIVVPLQPYLQRGHLWLI